MNKQDQAMYLVNLLALMDSQFANLGQGKQVLAEEYRRGYEEFKATLKQEHENEARNK